VNHDYVHMYGIHNNNNNGNLVTRKRLLHRFYTCLKFYVKTFSGVAQKIRGGINLLLSACGLSCSREKNDSFPKESFFVPSR
jgi:hypothetical protein